jgi:hypothetical protein
MVQAQDIGDISFLGRRFQIVAMVQQQPRNWHLRDDSLKPVLAQLVAHDPVAAEARIGGRIRAPRGPTTWRQALRKQSCWEMRQACERLTCSASASQACGGYACRIKGLGSASLQSPHLGGGKGSGVGSGGMPGRGVPSGLGVNAGGTSPGDDGVSQLRSGMSSITNVMSSA